MLKTGRCRYVLAPLGAIALALPNAAFAQGTHRFDIPAQSLDSALKALARASGEQVVYRGSSVRGKKSAPVSGSLTSDQALDLALRGTGLVVRRTARGVLIVQPASVPAMGGPDTGENNAGGAPADDESADGQDEQEVVVTGTRIAPVARQFSPAVVATRDNLDLAGFDTAADFFDKLPQNFGGGASPDTSVAGSIAGSGAASVNLRGLGNEATLILLNGRRLPTSGILGGFVDISTLPSSLIERIEVVADGASAIYGSDAIAGVANIILRDDFKGAETRVGWGGYTSGGGESVRLAQTLGFSNDSGHGVVSYSYQLEDNVRADDRGWSSELKGPKDLLPYAKTHSLFAAGGVRLASNLELSGDGYYSQRDARSIDYIGGTLNSNNDGYVDLEKYGGGLFATLDLGRNWQAQAVGAYGKEDRYGVTLQPQRKRSIVDIVDYDLRSLDMTVGGPLFHLTAEPIRMVVGGHLRRERINSLSYGSDLALTPPATLNRIRNRRTAKAAFGELYIPIIAGEDGVPGLRKLALTAAARFEDYQAIGSTFDYKLGLSWRPVSELNLRGTYATSFRAPSLYQARDAISGVTLILYQPTPDPATRTVALRVGGASTEVSPEEADVWTLGADYEPRFIDGLRLSGTYFQVDYQGRIGTPRVSALPGVPYLIYTNAEGLIENNPSPELVQSIVAQATSFTNASLILPGYPSISLDQVTTILWAYAQNLGSSFVEGLELQADYRFETGLGRFALGLNGTYLLDFRQQTSPGGPELDILNTFGNPVDLRLRASADLQRGFTTLSLFVNHTGDYIDDKVVGSEFRIKPWTTVDASVRLDLGQLSRGSFPDASLVLAVTNLFDKDPPAVGVVPLRDIAYDPANASPGGRQVSLLLTKKW